MLSKLITSKLHPSPTSICFIPQINIMHEYTETESKYTSKIGTHSMWEEMHIILGKLKIMLSKAMLKFLKLKKNKHTFYVNNHSPNIFPVLANFSLCQNKIIMCFPCLEKVRTKFRIFPVPLPP